MGYRSLQQCVEDLDRSGHLIRVEHPVDPNLEIAEIQRRVYANQGPAVLFDSVPGCSFSVVSNLFGSLERSRFMFRDTLKLVQQLVELKIDPAAALQQPARYARSIWLARTMRPRRVRRGPVLQNTTSISNLPQIKCWPDDGGAFITLPQVYSEDVERPGCMHSNLGMYRVQLSGESYAPDREIGLHYQIHRGIGVHHSHALQRGVPFRVNIFLGGTPAMTLAAVMPLPEGMSELTFAGALAGHRIPMVQGDAYPLPLYAEADFCIVAKVIPNKLLPEGPFGDHLGYYSLRHDFPVLQVEKVYHRAGAIWPFTVVGRPPQEDTSFGQLIHELSGPAIPSVLPGVRGVHAVDAAGVHPLLLAVGSERYTPFDEPARPQELLTQANAILGQGQLSLAKYLLIANQADDPALDVHDIKAFFRHMLQRADWKRDLHFQTQTTIDTLDYSGDAINRGSKVVIAAVGPPRYELTSRLPVALSLPEGFSQPTICQPGILAVQGPSVAAAGPSDPRTTDGKQDIDRLCRELSEQSQLDDGYRLIVVVDDADFVARAWDNFLWVVFTRSNPARDIHGLRSAIVDKHWGCEGPLVIDARLKSHHAPPLIEDPQIAARVDAMATRNTPLARYL